MAASNRDACMAIIFKHEGGYANHPKDPGGCTNMGITLATLRDWRGEQTDCADVKALTKAETIRIYERKYWDVLNCDNLPAGVDLVTFDMGVNAGPARSAKMLQKLVGVPADGKIGPATIEAVRKRDESEIIRRFSEERMRYYQSLPTWPTFGAGWHRRTQETQAAALGMVGGGGSTRPSGGFLEALAAWFQRIFGGKA